MPRVSEFFGIVIYMYWFGRFELIEPPHQVGVMMLGSAARIAALYLRHQNPTVLFDLRNPAVARGTVHTQEA